MTGDNLLPVTLRDDSQWDQTLPASGLAYLLMLLLNHDYRANDQSIFPLLGLDMATRRKGDNVPKVKARRTREYRIINKALSMEMLSALLLARLNSAQEVRSWCVLKHGLPHYFAPSKSPDVSARYHDADGNLAFRVVGEVSAKRQVTRKFFRKQLRQAWRRASELAEDSENGVVYALAINGGAIGSDVELWDEYRRFRREKKIEPDGPVRLLPLYAGDVAAAIHKMGQQLPQGAVQFRSDLLASIFDALLDVLSKPTLGGELAPDWMCNTWVELVADEVTNARVPTPPSVPGADADF